MRFVLILIALFVVNDLQAQLVWTQQNSGTTTQFIDKVDFVDANVGYTLLYPDVVLNTVNGGSTWTATTIAGSDLNAISFVDAQTGWAIDYANANMYKTINGGSSWQLIYSNPSFSGYAYDIHFVDASHGWATRTDYVLYTTNGGSSWDSISSPGGADLFFVNQQKGFILDGNFLNYTTNGGTVWNSSTVWTGGEYLSGFCAVNETNIWAVGDNGLIRHSTNGGVSWVTNSYGVYNDLKGVRFFDANNGIAVGVGGLVISTADGGITWVTNSSGVGADLYQLDIVSPGRAWVTGDSGTIISSFPDTDVTIDNYIGISLVCKGSTVALNFDVKNNGSSPITSGSFSLLGTAGTALTYNWNGLISPGSVEQINIGTITMNQTETFTVTFTGDANTSNNIYSFVIDVIGESISFSGPHLICPTDSVTIYGSGGLYYNWDDFSTSGYDSSVTFTPTESAYYGISIEDSYGCYYYDSIQVELDQTCGDTLMPIDTLVPIDTLITINNSNIALTPNNDGKNDYLILDGIDSTINTVIVYNRWGDAVAIIENYNNEDNYWNCTDATGTVVAAGTYFFILEIPASNSYTKGWLQIIP